MWIEISIKRKSKQNKKQQTKIKEKNIILYELKSREIKYNNIKIGKCQQQK